MSTERLTTALLGKPGEIRDRLEAALREAGAELVLVADPMATDERAVMATAPRNVVVLMEPGVDEALDRFDALFDDPKIELLFEEASVLAARQGWDVARWGRHLAAKLRGSDEVLPAGYGDDAGFVAPQPRDALKSRPSAEVEGPVFEQAVPATPSSVFEQALPATPSSVFEQAVPATPSSVFEQPLPPAGGFGELAFADAIPSAEPVQPAPPVLEAPETLAFVGDWTPPVDLQPKAPSAFDHGDSITLDFDAPAAAAPVPHAALVEDFAFNAADFLDVAETIPDAPEASVPAPQPAQDFHSDAVDQFAALDFEPVSVPAADLKPMTSASAMDAPDMTNAPPPDKWALVDFEQEQTAPLNAGPGAGHRGMEGLSAIDDGTVGLDRPDVGGTTEVQTAAPVVSSLGAVLVVGGVGGPDPLRTLLGQLPADFPRPVLIQQHLDAGNYDRLARQMERATSLPVKLATPGMTAHPRAVYVLSNSLGIEVVDGALVFVEQPQIRGFADLTIPVDSADSALLVLSGAPIEVAEQALRFKVAGGWVAAQAQAGCFDHAVPAMVARGGADMDEPMGLAKKITARWHT